MRGCFVLKIPPCVNSGSIRYIKWGILIWFRLNPRNFNPRNFQFLVGFSFEVFTHCSPLSWQSSQSGPKICTTYRTNKSCEAKSGPRIGQNKISDQKFGLRTGPIWTNGLAVHGHETYIERCGIFLCIFWSMWEVCPGMPTYSNANAKDQKWIFDIQFQGNWFEFGIIENDFSSFTIRAI